MNINKQNKRIKMIDTITLIVIFSILFILLFNVFNKKNKVSEIKSSEDAAHSTIAVLTGSNAENLANIMFPEANIMTFNLNSDALYAVEIGNAKYGMALSFAINDYNKNRNNALSTVGEPLQYSETGIFFARNVKNKKVLPEFNEFITKISQNGELKEIDDRWFNIDTEIKNFDFDSLDNTNGTLIFAIDSAYPPFSYVYNNSVVGFDVEVVYQFCKEYKYGLDIKQVDFNGMLSGIKSGKFDIGGGGNTITEERKKSVDFSLPLKKNQMCLYTSNDKLETSVKLIDNIKESFYKTFIVESRYKLFLDGLKATLFMSISSIIIGTLLSFIICVLRLTGSKLLNKIYDVYVSILQGVPILVVLLLFYYTVFRSTDIRGEYVAVIAFVLNFSAYVSQIMITSIKNIDINQWESAFALGFGYFETFFRFIFKQSLVSIIPVYRGEVISLIKSTSIVGYIAVQDLTKMSDIIRSRTFEPFIPILTIALVYYMFSFIISNVLNSLLNKIDWKKVTGE